MAENLPIHMFIDKEKIVNNELDVSELSNNEEEIEYGLFKIVKLYHNYNIFLISDSHFNLQLGFMWWRIHRLTSS